MFHLRLRFRKVFSLRFRLRLRFGLRLRDVVRNAFPDILSGIVSKHVRRHVVSNRLRHILSRNVLRNCISYIIQIVCRPQVQRLSRFHIQFIAEQLHFFFDLTDSGLQGGKLRVKFCQYFFRALVHKVSRFLHLSIAQMYI